MRYLTAALAELKGTRVRVLDLLRVAVESQQDSGEAGLERDSLEHLFVRGGRS